MANKGYIKIARAIEDSEIWSKPPYYVKAWLHILNKAAFKPYGNLKTGECIISTEELQEVCSYKAGRRTEKPSSKQIRDFIEFLKSDEGNCGGNDESHKKDAMIVTKKVKGGMLVKVLNYELYQDSETYESNKESNNESNMDVTKKVIRKSDEGTNQIKEELKALETLKELKDKKSIDYQQIADMYNNTCVSFPRLTKLSDARKKAIKARLKTYTFDDLQKAFTMAEQSDFLKGGNNRNWSATFDWMLKDTNLAKILDGNYVNKAESKKELPTWFNDQSSAPVDTSDFDEQELLKKMEQLRTSER